MLCLARSGATDFARLEYARWRLGDDPRDGEAATLGARLLKDVALASTGRRRRAFARASAARYAGARHGGLYSDVNFATLSLIGGDSARARRAAAAILDRGADQGHDQSYYGLASRAEALLLLGRIDAARDAMAEAIGRAPRDHTGHASTIRQFEVILQETGAPAGWLDALRPPAIAHFTGRIFRQAGQGGRGHDDSPDAAQVAALAGEMRRAIADERIGFGYGGLAAGADILWAEALIDAGAELHVVLPTPAASFVATSVRPFGEAWVARFEACLARARSVRFAARDPYAGDDQVFAYSSQFAIGCAVLRADALATRAVQLAVAGNDVAGGSSVSADLRYWARTPRRQVVLTLPCAAMPSRRPVMPARTVMKAMLFVDVRGFGALRDDQVPAFFDIVMSGMARAITALARPPDHMETWGDGVFLVFDQPIDAAEAAMAILAAHRRLNLLTGGLPRWLALRIGGHYGPVHLRTNPILGNRAVVGAHVVVAARIEPNVAPGSAYVSEPLAGALATFHGDAFRCGYVGRTQARRDFPPLSIFNLSRRRPHAGDAPK